MLASFVARRVSRSGEFYEGAEDKTDVGVAVPVLGFGR